jgi:hypothetical protein
MGWVREKIADYKATQQELPRLWNSLRDSIGQSIAEFSDSISRPSVSHADCSARARPCVRISKPGQFIEVFLSTSDQSVKIASGTITISSSMEDGTICEVCRYRLTPDRSKLEFIVTDNNGTDWITADASEVSRRALEPFLFEPFPYGYIKPEA